MADFLDRLVARSRAREQRSRTSAVGFVVEDDVVTVPAPASGAPPPAVPGPRRTMPERPPVPAPVVSELARDTVRPTRTEAPPFAVPPGRPPSDPRERTVPATPLPPPPVASAPAPVQPTVQYVPTQQATHPATEPRVPERELVEYRSEPPWEHGGETRAEVVVDATHPIATAVAQPSVVARPHSVLPRATIHELADSATPPAVHIHIGRVEVRGEPEPAGAPAPPPAPTPRAAVLTLSDYLRGRAGAGS